MDSKTQILIEQIRKNSQRFNVPIMPSEGPFTPPFYFPFKCDYCYSIYFHNSSIGHRDLYIYTIGSDTKLVAVIAMHPSESFLNITEKLGMFYGVKYTKREEHPDEDAYIYYF